MVTLSPRDIVLSWGCSSPPGPAPPPPGSLPWGAWNCAGLSEGKLRALLLAAPRVGVILLSEVGDPTPELDALLGAWGWSAFWTRRPGAQRASGGTGVLCRPWLRPALVASSAEATMEHTTVRVVVPGGGGAVVVAATYVPPHKVERPALPAAVAAALGRLIAAHSPAVIAGDFNARHAAWDGGIFPGNGPSGTRGAHILRAASAAGRVVVPPPGPTCLRAEGGSALDFALGGPGWAHDPLSLVVLPSDHRGLLGCLTPRGVPAARGASALPWRPRRGVRWSAASPEALAAATAAVERSLPRRLPASVEAAQQRLVGVLHWAAASLPARSSGLRTFVPPRLREAGILASAACEAAARDPASAWLRATADVLRCRLMAAGAEFSVGPVFEDALAWKLFASTSAPQPPPPHSASAFADAFAALHANTDPDPVLPRLATAPHPITRAELDAALRRCSRGRAADGEGLQVEHLLLLGPAGREWLRLFLDRCLRHGLPECWRRSVVVPLLKEGGQPQSLGAYRPVALTSVVCRLLERIVLRRLSTAAPPGFARQFAYCRGVGTDMALMSVVHALESAFEHSCSFSKQLKQFRTAVAGCDFTSAFCRVRPSTILREARSSDWPAEYDAFLVSFLCGRELRVRCGASLSSCRALASGCPQGSVLGPLLWGLASSRVFEKVLAALSRSSVGRCGYPSGFTRARDSPPPPPAPPSWFGLTAYADDSVIWVSGWDSVKALDACRMALRPLADFSASEGIELSVKSSASVFLRRTPPADELAALTAYRLEVGRLAIPVYAAAPPHKGFERFVGARLDPGLTLCGHVQALIASAAPLLARLEACRNLLSPATARIIYLGAVQSRLLCGLPVLLNHISDELWLQLEQFQLRGARAVVSAVEGTSSVAVLAEAGLRSIRCEALCAAARLGAKCTRFPPLARLAVRRGGKLFPPLSASALPTTATWMYPDPCTTGPWDRVRILWECALVKEKSTEAQLLAENLSRFESNISPGGFAAFCDGSVGVTSAGVPASSAAFQIRAVDNLEVVHSSDSRALGPLPCSFSTEAEALRMALEACLRLPPTPLAVFVDCQGTLSALACGPCADVDPIIAVMFPTLLRLASDRTVSLVFVFSHVGWSIQDAVDAEAKSALNLHPHKEYRVWYKDEARPLRNQHAVDFGRAQMAASGGEWWKSHVPKQGDDLPIALLPPRLPPAVSKILLRLRMGVDPGLPGWKHGVAEPCRLCGASLSRDPTLGEHSVAHMFTCPSAPPSPAPPRGLWDPKLWPQLLERRRLFIR